MPNPSRKSRQDSIRVRLAKIQATVTIVTSLIKWGGIVGVFFFLYKAVDALSGEKTFADIMVRVVTDMRIDEKIAYLLGLTGTGYGLRQRKLRRDAIEKLAARNKELELMVDPGRSSSKLTKRGDTSPGDNP